MDFLSLFYHHFNCLPGYYPIYSFYTFILLLFIAALSIFSVWATLKWIFCTWNLKPLPALISGLLFKTESTILLLSRSPDFVSDVSPRVLDTFGSWEWLFLFVWKYMLSIRKTLFLESCTAWNYTTLKHELFMEHFKIGLTTIWNYTTLKQNISSWCPPCSLTTIWNYTTLKQRLRLQF